MDPNEVVNEALKEVAKKAAAEAWAGKSRLLSLVDRAWGFLRLTSAPVAPSESPHPAESPRGVLILGPGGTGKTTLARVLAGDVNVLIDPPGYYEPSLFVEPVPLLGAPGVELVVAPGQNYRLAPEFDALCEQLVGGAFRGVILVVDYGHHAIEHEWSKDHELYEGSKPAFVTALQAAQLGEELALLDKLAPGLKAITRKLWVLVVVLKQDLWARQQNRVVRHYQSGAWGARMGEIVAAVDPKLMFLHTCYACLHIQNHTTRGGRETLKKNASGYDAVRQRQSLEELFRAFDALRNWEETK